MNYELPKQLSDERDALVNRIRTAFNDVSREGGVSWNECVALDDFGDSETCAMARRSDCDTHWTELVNDPNWTPLVGIGGFSFLDAIGMRYYMPAAMLRVLRAEWDDGPVCFHLGYIGKGRIQDYWSKSKFVLFDHEQRVCVAAFLWFMARWSEALDRDSAFGLDDDSREWLNALNSRWQDYLPN